MLKNQGKYGEALEMYLAALRVFEKALGRDHPLVADTQYNIGLVHYNQGKYAEALVPYNAALKTRLAKLGPKQPFVAVCDRVNATHQNTSTHI